MPDSLIAPSNHWLLLSLLLVAAALGVWLERTNWGARLSGAVISILTTFLLSNLRIIPPTAPIYDVVWGYLVPLAIPLLLLRADLRRIIREAGPTLLAFVAGAIGTVLGTFVAHAIVPLGPQSWRLAGIFCATYIGGSMNYAGAAEALGLRAGDLLTAGVAADNLMMTLYFLVLFALPSSLWMRQRFAQRVAEASEGTDLSAEQQPASQLSLFTAAAGLAVSAVFCAAGQLVQKAINIRGSAILSLTALTVVGATVLPSVFERFVGAEPLGALLMQVFFAVIGASANIAVVLRVGTALFLFAGVILTIHLLVILAAGKLLRLDLAEVVIASNANMGGPTTAAAMAVARRWSTLVIPAILCGTLGYATATFIGTAVGHLLQRA